MPKRKRTNYKAASKSSRTILITFLRLLQIQGEHKDWGYIYLFREIPPASDIYGNILYCAIVLDMISYLCCYC